MIKNKNIIIIEIVFLFTAMLLALLFFANLYSFSNYRVIENKDFISKIKIIKGYLNGYEKTLVANNKDNSAWDDTYEFVDSVDKGYIEDNLNYETLKNIKVDFMIYVNKYGKIAYEKGYDPDSGEEINVPADLVNFIDSNKELIMFQNTSDNKSGFFFIDGKLVLISSMPIIKSDFSGPINGSLIFVRYIQKDVIDEIGSVVGLPINLTQLNNKDERTIKTLETFTDGSETIYLNPIDKSHMIVYSSLKDIQGDNSIVLDVKIPREIYLLGQKGKSMLHLITWVIGVISIMALIFILRKYVFKLINQQEALLNTIPAMVFYKNKDFKYILSNKYFADFVKTDLKDMKMKTDFELDGNINTINSARDLDLEIQRSLKPVLNIESKSKNEKGETIWLSTSKAPVLDDNGSFDGVVGVISDITSLKKMYEELDFAACYDKLTMLPNRNFFIKNLENRIEKEENKWREFSVLYIGIDKFKLINETMGYMAGDELLRVVAFRINQVLNMESLVSRISGDEFAVALNVTECSKLEDICGRILSIIKNAWEYEQKYYYLTASIGIAMFPKDGTSIEEILKNSHAALGQAKMNEINSFCYYSEELGDYYLKRLNIENELRLAAERKEFVLYYQPQIELKTNKIIGVEALIRWKHPKKGIIPPGAFIPIVEENGQIIQIGEWVIEESCKQIREWRNKGINELKVSINVSAKQFESDNLINKIQEEIIKNDIEFSSLEVEVTESILMKDKESTLKKLNILRSMGINILLDDFGTGYSSLLYLKTFPIDKLKIDQNFIKEFNRNEDTLIIVKIIILLASELGIKTIAEGVEFTDQYEKLKELGCEEIQGFLFGRPSLPEVIERSVL